MNRRQESGFAEVDDASLYYEILGEGEPLVLLHAGIADRRMWDEQFGAFAERNRVVRYDRRDFGRSALLEGPYSHHDDLRGLLDHLGIERASFVGCSMGGGAVIDFALSNPERARALVLVGSAVSGVESDETPPEEWEELVAADELERVSELEVRIWVDGPYRDPGAVDPAVRDLVREMNLIALQSEASGLGEIRASTLVVALDRPEIVARSGLLAHSIPHAQRILMDGTAHLPNMEMSGEFNQAVLKFLAA
ncbi:MAG TPA: alpha/beta fold hydrolase [Rubrobacteraceae bacterium]|nr:alpha/beta fold hydrolase [Rubrobacteraceae bacterium]